MSKGLQLSPKHGVNATIPICFWCGKEKDELTLLGKLKDDKKAPMSCYINYEPCDICRSHFAEGVHVIEVDSINKMPDKRPAISQSENGEKLAPTGRYLVIRSEAAKGIFPVNSPDMLDPGEAISVDTRLFDELTEFLEPKK